jgi:hypothetical protein
MRNRIINGDMRIDQRNNGGSVSTNLAYPVDRFFIGQSTAGAWTSSRSTGVPTGFINSLQFTKTTGNAPASGEFNYLTHVIEGFNIADLGWGTASAQTVTLSFQVFSGAAGTFGGSLRSANAGGFRVYPFTYTISSANTWTSISVTIPGDTTGTWATNNTSGIFVFFDLGSGTAARGTAGAWAAANQIGATGTSTYPVSTSGGSMSWTGIQLEKGTQATSFEYRQYQQELALCQRYYYKIKASNSLAYFGMGTVSSATGGEIMTFFPVPLRTAPTALEQSGTAAQYQVISGSSGLTCSAVPAINIADIWGATTTFTVASGGNNGYAALLRALLSTNAFLAWSAELT